MKKIFILFVLFYISFSLRAQISAEFTWCPVYDTTLQICCIQFEDLSVDSGGTITTYFWSFGDGGSSTIADPRWCYSISDTFEVWLIVTGPSGTDTMIHPLHHDPFDSTNCNCDSLIGVNEISSGGFSISVSPNPFHDKTTLSWHSAGNKKLQDAEIRIYNSLSKLMRVEKIVLGERQEIIFERKSLPAGIYYFEISTMDAIKIGQGKFLIE